MNSFTLAFYVTISVVSVLSVAASLWIAYKCKQIDFGYAGLELSNAEILRQYVYRLAVWDVLFSLHYLKFIFIFVGQDSLFNSGIGRHLCIILAVYTEFCLVATITWYFIISVLLLYTFKVGREPYVSKKAMIAQRVAVALLSSIFVILPCVISGGVDKAYGPKIEKHLDVVNCDIGGKGEIPHDVLLASMVIFSIFVLFIVIYYSRNAFSVTRRKIDFATFLWKRVSFTTCFVFTYAWRPLMVLTGSQNYFLWLTANVFIASSGIGYYMMWFLQIQHHFKVVRNLSLEREKTASEFIFRQQPKANLYSGRTSMDSNFSLDYYPYGTSSTASPQLAARDGDMFPYNQGSPKKMTYLPSFDEDLYSPSPSTGVRIFTKISEMEERSMSHGGDDMADYSLPSEGPVILSRNNSGASLLKRGFSSESKASLLSFGQVDFDSIHESSVEQILNAKRSTIN